MNIEHRAAARRVVVLLLLTAGCGLLLGPAAAQEANKEQEPKKSLPVAPNVPAEVQVITLKNASAKDVALMVNNLIRGRFLATPVTVAVDQTTNALLVGGSAEEIARIREIIAKLDVPRDDAAKSTEVQSIALKNASATDTSSVLGHLLGEGSGVSIVAVPANNSLLVRGTAADIAKAREIIAKLDVPRDDASARPQLQVFQLQSIEPDEALEEALRLVIKGKRAANFALDARRKVLVVSADEVTLKTIETLLAQLKGEWGEGRGADVQVRVIWLISGPGRPDEPAAPDDLKEVLPALAKLGIDRPRLAAQTLVNVNPNANFTARGTAKLEAPCSFDVEGLYSDKKDSPVLEISIVARGMQDRGPVVKHENICNLRTKISAPLGHLVVLGVTPTESTTSVFVVQVLSKDAKKPMPK
jgi:Bacterial type II/III secretion system short domain